MDAFVIALKEEEKQAQKLIKKYEKELARLPAGTFFVRLIGKNSYAYLTYSKNGIIKQKYLGLLEEKETQKYKDFSARKRKLKALLQKAKRQHQFLKKALKHAF